MQGTDCSEMVSTMHTAASTTRQPVLELQLGSAVSRGCKRQLD